MFMINLDHAVSTSSYILHISDYIISGSGILVLDEWEIRRGILVLDECYTNMILYCSTIAMQKKLQGREAEPQKS